MRTFLAANITAVLVFFFGTYLLVVFLVECFRQPLADAEANEERKRKKRKYFLLSMSFFVLSLWIGLSNRHRAAWDAVTHRAAWDAVTSEDGVASIEMPGTPEASEQKTTTEFGTLVTRMLVLKRDRHTFVLGDSGIAGPNAGGPVEDQLQSIRKNLISQIQNKTGARVEQVRDQDITQSGCKGIELEHQSGDYTIKLRVFIVAGRSYSATVQVPTEAKDAPVVQRFLDSFTIRKTDGKD
jgi:hypothetical protein